MMEVKNYCLLPDTQALIEPPQVNPEPAVQV